MSIFPSTPKIEFIETTNNANEFKEYAIDLKTKEMIYKDGKNVILIGKDALKIWIWKALQTTKNKYKAYSNFGNEFNSIIGQSFSESLSKTLLEQLVKECLFQNKFIKDVSDFKIKIDGAKIEINILVLTSFGEVIVNV